MRRKKIGDERCIIEKQKSKENSSGFFKDLITCLEVICGVMVIIKYFQTSLWNFFYRINVPVVDSVSVLSLFENSKQKKTRV